MHLRRALLGVAVALFVGSCGGGAESRKPDAGVGTDGSADTPAGQDAASDRPFDGGAGGGGDGAVDQGGDGGGMQGLPLGQPCAQASECVSGFCADGVCCGSACTEVCRTCAAQGSLGTCLPADLGTDPRNDVRHDSGIASCGNDGVCDGAGACEKYSSGATLSGSDLRGLDADVGVPLRRRRRVRAPAGQSCAPFGCGTDGKCLVLCANDADCVSPNSCVNGSCGKKPLGGTCGNAAECNSGFCEQGICCAAPVRVPAAPARCRAAPAPAPTCPTARIRWASAPTVARRSAAPTVSATAREAAACTPRARSASRPAARSPPPPSPAAATAPASARPARSSRASRTSAGRAASA